MENSVVCPDSGLNLFVNANALRGPFSLFETLRRHVKSTILGQAARWMSFRLVHNFWIGTRSKFRVVMPFVHERCSTIFKTITIRRIWAHGHQNYGVIPAQPKVHPLLKACTFSLAHINVGDDVIAHRVQSTTTEARPSKQRAPPARRPC